MQTSSYFPALDALNLDSAKLSNLEQVLNGEITKFQRNGPVSEKDVTLYLYSSSKDGVVLTKDNLDEVDVSSTLVFIVHGWTASVNDSWVIKLRQSYLKKENYNVVEVDWSKPADKVYTISAGYVDDLGKRRNKITTYKRLFIKNKVEFFLKKLLLLFIIPLLGRQITFLSKFLPVFYCFCIQY